MKEIKLLEHVLANLKADRAAGHGLLLDGEVSTAIDIFSMGCYRGYALAPRTHKVNGFTVPAPESEPLEDGAKYFIENPTLGDWNQCLTWCSDSTDLKLLERELIHLTKDAAIANAKAHRGFDPKWGEK